MSILTMMVGKTFTRLIFQKFKEYSLVEAFKYLIKLFFFFKRILIGGSF
jgi:hypothetical protein